MLWWKVPRVGRSRQAGARNFLMVRDTPRFRKVAGAARPCRRGSLEIFTTPSLVVHFPLDYLTAMYWHRVASGVLILIAVQYAATAAGGTCPSDASCSAADAAMQGMAHDGESPTPKSPCAPGSQQPGHGHSTTGCAAMTACAPGAAVAAVNPVAFVAASVTVPTGATFMTIHSLRIPPDTPPPIA